MSALSHQSSCVFWIVLVKLRNTSNSHEEYSCVLVSRAGGVQILMTWGVCGLPVEGTDSLHAYIRVASIALTGPDRAAERLLTVWALV
eukprot:650909-Amphidinium_carterae.1